MNVLTNWLRRDRRDDGLRESLFRAARWTVLGVGLGRGISVVATLAAAEIIGPRAFGGFALVQTTVVLLSTVACFSTGLAATQQISRFRSIDLALAGRHVALALVTATVGSVCVGGILLLTADVVGSSALQSPHLAPTLRMGVLLLIATAIGTAQMGILFGLEDFRRASFINLARGASLVPALILGAKTGGLNGAILGLGAGEIIGCVLGQVLVRRSCRERLVPISYRQATRERRTLLTLNLPAFGGTMATQPALWLAQLLLARTANGLTELGYFAVAYRWYLLLTFVSAALAPMGLAMLTRVQSIASASTYRAFLSLTARVNVVSTIPPALVVVILAPMVVQLSGASYVSASLSLRILAVAAVASAANNVLGQTALSLGLVRAWVVSDVVLAVVLVTGTVALIGGLGAAGLSAAFAASMLATCAALIPALHSGLKGTAPDSPV